MKAQWMFACVALASMALRAGDPQSADARPGAQARGSILSVITERALGEDDIKRAKQEKRDKRYISSLQSKVKLAEATRKAKEQNPDAEPKFEAKEPARMAVVRIGEETRLMKILNVGPLTQSGIDCYFPLKLKDMKGTLSLYITNHQDDQSADATMTGAVLGYFQLMTETQNYVLTYQVPSPDNDTERTYGLGDAWFKAATRIYGGVSGAMELEFIPVP